MYFPGTVSKMPKLELNGGMQRHKVSLVLRRVFTLALKNLEM